MEKSNCSVCSKEILIESNNCSYCGQSDKKECPNCQKMIPFNSTVCPYCNSKKKNSSSHTGSRRDSDENYLKYKGAKECQNVLESLKNASTSLNMANYFLGQVSGTNTSEILAENMEAAIEAAKNDSKYEVSPFDFNPTTIPLSFGDDNIKSLSNSITNTVSSAIDISQIIGSHFGAIKEMEDLQETYDELMDWYINLGDESSVVETINKEIGPDDPAYSRDDFITKWEDELSSELSNNPYKSSGVDFGNFDAIVGSYLSKIGNTSETKSKMLLDLTYIGYVDLYGLENLSGLSVLMRDHSNALANSIASFQAGLETEGVSSIYGFSKDLGIGSFSLPSIIFGGIDAITGNLDYKYLNGVARCDAIMNSPDTTNVQKVQAKQEKEKLEEEHNKPNNSRKSTDYEKAENAFNNMLDSALEVNKEIEADLQAELKTKNTIMSYTTPLSSAAGQLVGELLNSYRAGETVTRPTEEYMRSLGIMSDGDFKYVNDHFDIIEAGYERRITELQDQTQSYLYLKNELKNHTFNTSILELTKNSNFSEKSESLELIHNNMIENYYASNPVDTSVNPRDNTITIPNLPIGIVLIDGEKYIQDKTTGTIINANEFNWLAFQNSINEFASVNDWAGNQVKAINKSVTNLMNIFFSDVGFSRDAKWSTIPNIIDYYNNEFKKYATKDEIAVFNYIANCEDTTAALKYLDLVRTPINNRVGTAEGQVFNDFIKNNLFENVRNDLLKIEKSSSFFSSLNLSNLAQKAVDIVEQARNYSNDSNEVSKFFNDAFVKIFDVNEYLYDLKHIAMKGGISGVQQFGSGMSNLFGGVDGVLSINDYRNQMIGKYLSTDFLKDLNTNNKDVEKFLQETGRIIGTGTYEVSTSIGNMLPSIAASVVSNFIIPGSGAIVGAALMGLSAGGNAWEQGFQESGKYYMSLGYGALVGLSEATLQYFLGKITGLSKGTSFIDDAINVGRSTPKEIIEDLLSEGKEEMIQELLDPFFKTVLFGNDYEVDPIAVIKSGVYGVISAGIMNGGSFIINTAINDITQPIKVTEIISAFTAQEFEIINRNNLCNTPNQLSLLYQAAQQLNKGNIAKYNQLMSLLIMASTKDGVDVSANDSTIILHDNIRSQYETSDHLSKITDENVTTSSQTETTKAYDPIKLIKFDSTAKTETRVEESLVTTSVQESNPEKVPRVELSTEIQTQQTDSKIDSEVNSNIDINNDKSSAKITESASKQEVPSSPNLANNAVIESSPIDGLIITQNSTGTDVTTNSTKSNDVTNTNSSSNSSTSSQSVVQDNISATKTNNIEVKENNAVASTVAVLAANPQLVQNNDMDISDASMPTELSKMDDLATTSVGNDAQNYANSLIDKVIKKMPNGLSVFEKARYLYLELGKIVSYSDYYFLQTNATYGNPQLAQDFYYMEIDPSKVTKNTELICRQWSKLYRDTLIKAGVDPNAITLVGYPLLDADGNIVKNSDGTTVFENGTHVAISIKIQDGFKIVADATNNFKDGADLYKIKAGMPDAGFVIVESDANALSIVDPESGLMLNNRLNSEGLLHDIDQQLEPYLSPNNILAPEIIDTINTNFGGTDVYQQFDIPGLNPETAEIDNSFINLNRLQTNNGINAYLYARNILRKMKLFSKDTIVDLSLLLKPDNSTHTSEYMLYFNVINFSSNVSNNYVFSIDGKLELVEDASSFEKNGWVRVINGDSHFHRNQNVDNAIEEKLENTLDLNETVAEVKKVQDQAEMAPDELPK